MLKQRKEEIVSSLTEELGGVSQMIVADPTGLTVAEMKELRNRLRPSGAEFRVAKNTLARIAARAAGREELVGLLVGPTAITLVPGDPAAAAKTLSDFGRTSRKLAVRGAYLDGATLDAESVRQLACWRSCRVGSWSHSTRSGSRRKPPPRRRGTQMNRGAACAARERNRRWRR
jgi:large subunit ribosomal protein L10